MLLLMTLAVGFPGEAAEGERERERECEYIVTAEILPILKAPGGSYEKTGDGGIEYSDDIDGVVVYGNRLKLRTTGVRPNGGVFALLSPEDGSVLGYIPGEGVEEFPDCEPTNGALYMAARDAPELSLTLNGHSPNGRGPNEHDGKSELPGRDFSLLKGEVVPSYGKRGGKILLSFGTLSGAGGVGERFAWADGKDFIALDSYEPDNARIVRALIPSARRLYGGDYMNVETLPKEWVDSIEKRGFLIDEKPLLPEYGVTVDDMADLYSRTAPYEADFITTDIFLHSFHLLFDQALQKFERTFLAPRLAVSVKEAVDLLNSARRQIKDGEFADRAFDTARDMLSVTLALLSEKPLRELSPRAKAEVAKIMSASDMEESEITGQKIDYTLFRPRGHYTVSPEFERYFRAVSYLGLAELPLFGPDGKPVAHNVAAAAILSLALDANRRSWEEFEDPMNFLVGVPNGGDPKIYRDIARKHLGSAPDAWKNKNFSGEKIEALARDIAERVPGHKIQSVAGIDRADKKNEKDSDFGNRNAVFRISPRRFTYDAWIMNRLTSPRVGTDANPRNMPEGTDVMAVLGSSAADALSKSDYGVKNYEANLAALKGEAAEVLAGENTVFAGVLETFRAGFEDSGSEQFFYKSEGWRWKKLATNLASWAELKHDTILYAEQSMAEMGDGGDWYAGRFEPPQPRGFVEPAPQFFRALRDATGRLLAFIEEYGVEGGDDEDETSYSERLERFSELIETMETAARKEIDKETLSPEEYAAIKETTRAFDAFLLLPGSGFPMENAELRKMACVADVATNGWDRTVLEAASGAPRAIYVFVDDRSGGARVTKGYVFSYYEFERPMDRRMTDEEWKTLVYDPARAEELEVLRPRWHEEFRTNTR
jgi:hypothetical protein